MKLYLDILHSKQVAALCSGHGVSDASALSIISSLKKLCNMPDLLYSARDGGRSVYLHTTGVPVLCCFKYVFFWPLSESPVGVHIACACLIEQEHLPACRLLAQHALGSQHLSICTLSCAPVTPCPKLGASICQAACTMHGVCELFPDLLQIRAC